MFSVQKYTFRLKAASKWQDYFLSISFRLREQRSTGFIFKT